MSRRRTSGGGGGITAGTQSLLTDMMNSSGLTAFQKRQLTKQLQTGGPLPREVKPTTSEVDRAPRQKKAPRARVNVRTYQGGKRQAKEIKAHVKATEPPVFKPKAGVDRQAQKEYTQDVLMYGRDMADRRKALLEKAKRGELVERVKPKKPEVVEDESFERAAADVGELMQHLEQMERLGSMDAATRGDIKLQISQAIREMEAADRRRSVLVQRAQQGGLVQI